MKKVIMMLLAAAAMLTSCETKTGTYALAGGLVGGAAGAGIGAAVAGGTGAAIGAGIGVASGALIGGAIGNSEDRCCMERCCPRVLSKCDRCDPLSYNDIKEMSKAGVSDGAIINQIKASGSSFNLSSADIADLRNAGVSQSVIDAMNSCCKPRCGSCQPRCGCGGCR